MATSGDTTQSIEPEEAIDEVKVKPLRIDSGIINLPDKTKYFGQISKERIPNGMGKFYTMHGTHYAGEISLGKKHGYGVEHFNDGSEYSGMFEQDTYDGYGVYTSPFGEIFLGQWKNSTRDGHGISLNPSGDAFYGVYESNELQESIECTWKQLEVHVLRAMLAQKRANECQEKARSIEYDVVMEQITTIDTKTFNTHEEILAFEEQEQQDFATVKKEKQEKLNELMEIIHANEYKEAELNQKQKELRAAITERSKELSFVAQFLDLEEQRTNELHDAQRTLEILQKQMERLQMDLDARKREYSISEAERRAAEENHIHTPSSATISIPPSPR